MTLDELQQAWAAHRALLERSLAIDERLLRETLLRKVRSSLRPWLLGRAVEVACGVAALAAAVRVVAGHFAEPRYLLVAAPFALFAAAMTALCAWLLVRGLRIDYGGAVTAIQRDVERLRLAEYRAFKWALLGGVLFWLPALLILFEAATGVAALARADLAYLLSNLAFGVVVLAVGHAWSRRHVERSDLAPWAQRLVDALTDRKLRAASGHLAELSEFVREEGEPARGA